MLRQRPGQQRADPLRRRDAGGGDPEGAATHLPRDADDEHAVGDDLHRTQRAGEEPDDRCHGRRGIERSQRKNCGSAE